MPAILIVVDKADLREMLAESFEQSGHTVYTAGTVTEASKPLEQHLPDLVLLDWMLPDATGLNCLRQIRRIDRFRTLPVIMLTARGEVGDRVAGLDGGTDDYIVNPFSLKELQARLRSRLRTQQPPADQVRLELGRLVLDSSTHRVMAGMTEINLGPTEFRLLRQFMASIQALPDATVVLDKAFRIQWMNDAASTILGIKRSDTGQVVTELLRNLLFREHLASGAYGQGLYLESPHDKRLRIAIRIVPFERKQYLLENMRRDFVSNAAHELRTPLTVLQGSLEQLEGEIGYQPGLANPVARMKRQSDA